jgi:hypothetical protein
MEGEVVKKPEGDETECKAEEGAGFETKHLGCHASEEGVQDVKEAENVKEVEVKMEENEKAEIVKSEEEKKKEGEKAEDSINKETEELEKQAAELMEEMSKPDENEEREVLAEEEKKENSDLMNKEEEGEKAMCIEDNKEKDVEKEKATEIALKIDWDQFKPKEGEAEAGSGVDGSEGNLVVVDASNQGSSDFLKSELNQEYMNLLKYEIEQTTEFITKLIPIDVIVDEYQDNKFHESFLKIKQEYKYIRKLRRDGNQSNN